MSKRLTLEQINQKINEIEHHYGYQSTSTEIMDWWDLKDKMQYGRLLRLKWKRESEEENK
jgi:hypothetical protein